MNLTKGEAGKIISEGMSYAKLGKHKKAISFFDKVLKGEQYNADALYSKGLSLAKLGKHKEAISCFEKILERDQEFFQSKILLPCAYPTKLMIIPCCIRHQH